MDLALVSVAAILLLLSGMRTSAQTPQEPVDATATMRLPFVTSDEAPHACATSSNNSLYQPSCDRCTCWHSTLRPLPTHSQTRWPDLLLTRSVTSNAPGGFARRQYRTRFGFADGAYRALGPPLTGPSIKFG